MVRRSVDLVSSAYDFYGGGAGYNRASLNHSRAHRRARIPPDASSRLSGDEEPTSDDRGCHAAPVQFPGDATMHMVPSPSNKPAFFAIPSGGGGRLAGPTHDDLASKPPLSLSCALYGKQMHRYNQNARQCVCVIRLDVAIWVFLQHWKWIQVWAFFPFGGTDRF